MYWHQKALDFPVEWPGNVKLDSVVHNIAYRVLHKNLISMLKIDPALRPRALKLAEAWYRLLWLLTNLPRPRLRLQVPKHSGDIKGSEEVLIYVLYNTDPIGQIQQAGCGRES